MKKLVVVFGILLVPAVAGATPQPLPFTYVYETLPKGSLEVEQYADFTPIRVQSSAGGNQSVLYGATQLQTEFEYGISDRLELGLYVTFAPSPPSGEAYPLVPPLTEGNGLKERLRLRLAEAGEWPVDVGLYGELVENEREVELEAKIILERHIGDLRIVANLWAEREYEQYDIHQGDWVINPTLGVTYQVTPAFHPGIEGWMRAEYPDSSPARTFDLGPQAYVGPTMMFDFGNFWWSTGFYFRVTDVGHTPDPAITPGALDAFGNVWMRMIFGLAF
jgi:hypothetical protein